MTTDDGRPLDPRYYDTVKGIPRRRPHREPSGGRRLPADPCTWCGHVRHAPRCPRTACPCAWGVMA